MMSFVLAVELADRNNAYFSSGKYRHKYTAFIVTSRQPDNSLDLWTW